MSLWSAPTALALAGVLLLVLLMAHVSLASPARVLALYREHFHDARQERLFLSSAAFFGAFVAVRAITFAIRLGVGPFHDVTRGQIHVHHLVWGILLLLGVGYIWLLQLGTGIGLSSRWASRAAAVLYGVGAALTLDEFALWLRLEDVYWSRAGRESVEAVLMFGALLSVGLWGRPFFRALIGEAARALRRV